MKNKNAWAIIVLVLLVAGGAIWYIMSKANEVPTDTTGTTGTTQTTGTHMMTGAGGVKTTGTGGTANTDTRPKITSITPNNGKIATVAMIKGVNFDSKANVITFGPSKGLHKIDGSADNEVATIASSDGMTLSFSVPSAIGSGNLCDQNNKCAVYGPTGTTAGTYMVTVINKNGVSNEFSFAVK